MLGLRLGGLRPGDPEIGHHAAAVMGEQDVLRLHVPVDDALLVGVLQRPRGLPRDAQRLPAGPSALPLESVPHRLALDVRHGEPETPCRLARVVDRNDVGVLQPGRELDLAKEALGAHPVRRYGIEDLERDLAVVAEIPGEPDRRHAALAQSALDGVAVAQTLA